MRKIKVMVDKTSYKTKPNNYEAGGIQNRLKNSSTIEEIELQTLIEYLKKGYSTRPAILRDGAKKEDFQQQDVIYVDIDNDKDKTHITTLDEALAITKKYNLKPYAYYYTFSHCEKYPRFRLIFILNETIIDINKMEFALKILYKIFPNADMSCANVAKQFYGSNGEVHTIDCDAIITFEDIINISEDFIVEDIGEMRTSTNSYNNELTELINNFNLFEYVSKDNKNYRISGDKRYIPHCPICGHKDCFVIYTNTNTFYCFGANGGQGGNIINYLSITKKLSIPQAIDYFKYEILGLPKEKRVIKNFENILRVEQECLNEINENLRDDNINFNSISELKWLDIHSEKKLIRIKVSCSELADYINNNCYYLFMDSLTDNKVIKYKYNKGVYNPISDTKFKSFITKFIPNRVLKSCLVEETFKLLITKEEHYTQFDELNNNYNLINFKDGLYNVMTDELLPHTPKYKSTIQYDFKYPLNIKKPEYSYFDDFMDCFTNHDKENRKFLLQYGGSTISNYPGHWGKSALFFLSEGNTGKTLYININIALLGEQNCATVDLSDLEKPFHTIKLLGKRLASFNDMSGIKMKNLSRFKMLTGGDNITDSYKGKDLVDFKYNGTLMFAGNLMPNWGGDKGNHVFERMIFIEPKNVIPEEKRDKQLLEKILKEKEYIMSLYIQGLKEYITNGFKYDIPKSSLEIRNQVMVNNDSILTFINECTETVIREPERIDLTTGEFYKLYVRWCKYNNNNYCETNKIFAQTMLKHLGIDKPKKCFNGNTYYPGIVPTEDTLKNYWENDRY